MNKIEQIVLDVLEEEKSVFDEAIGKEQFRGIAKSISLKIKTLNNKEVSIIIIKLINDLANINYGVCDCITGRPEKDYVINRTNIINKAINQICNLAIKEEGNNSQGNGY